MRRLDALPLVVLASFVVSWSALADEQRAPVPQHHELAVTLDVLVEKKLSGGNATLRYTFLAQSLNRIDDEVVPIMRRFIYHPNALTVFLRRITTNYDQISGAGLGGTLSFGGNILTLDVEAAIESVDVRQDPVEPGYLAAPVHLELQTHILPRTRIAAYADIRRALKATTDKVINTPSKRDGGELEVGAGIAGCSCGDRLFGEVRAGWKSADWTFTGIFAGDLTASGPVVSAQGSYQFTDSTSLQLRADFESLKWDDTRANDRDRIEGSLDPRAMRLDVNLDFIYWYRGTYGLRVTLGGGLQQRRPVFADEDAGFGRFGFAVTSRF